MKERNRRRDERAERGERRRKSRERSVARGKDI